MEDLIVEIDEREFNITYAKNEFSELKVNGNSYKIELLKKISDNIWSLSVNNRLYQIEFDLDTDGNATIYLDGLAFEANITNETKKLLKQFVKAAGGGNDSGIVPVKSPMPGMVVKIIAEEGQQVAKGDKIIIIEAMKMENALAAQSDGIIKNIKVSEAQAVEKNALLMEIHAQ